MYGQEVKFELLKDKISLIDSYQVNDQVSSHTPPPVLAHAYTHTNNHSDQILVSSDYNVSSY
jgi:hypothetical protein